MTQFTLHSLKHQSFCFPILGKLFLGIFSFPNIGKAAFSVFRPSYPYESFFLVFSVHRTPTKVSFGYFSFIVSLRKFLFLIFR